MPASRRTGTASCRCAGRSPGCARRAPGAEVQAAEIRRLHRVLWKERIDKAAVRRVLDETVQLYAGTRRLRDQHDRVVSLSDDVGRLRYALQRSEAVKGRLKARLHRRAEAARAPVAGCGGRGSAQGPGPVASAQGDDRQAAEGERPAAADGTGVGAPDRDAGGRDCEAARDPSGAVEGVARPQEREAGEAAHGPPARPASRRSRPRPHATLRTGGTRRGAASAACCAHLFWLRQAPTRRSAWSSRPWSRSRSGPIGG